MSTSKRLLELGEVEPIAAEISRLYICHPCTFNVVQALEDIAFDLHQRVGITIFLERILAFIPEPEFSIDRPFQAEVLGNNRVDGRLDGLNSKAVGDILNRVPNAPVRIGNVEALDDTLIQSAHVIPRGGLVTPPSTITQT